MKIGIILAGLAGILALMLVGIASAEVRINEAELNPAGTDAGNEWIEFYSDNPVNLTNFNLANYDNDTLMFNASFQGYYIFNFSSGWLDNSNEKITLKNSTGSIISETILLNDSYDDGRTWQYCNGSWIFRAATRGAENNCTQSAACSQNWSCSSWGSCSSGAQARTCTDTSSCGNNTGKPSQSQSCSEGAVSIELSWTDENIINGQEFEITVNLENLEDRHYDVKAWIENDDETIISERYGNYSGGEIKWAGGDKWAYNFAEGSGDKSGTIKLRIKSSYSDFSGDATIFAKIRENGETTEEDIFEKSIEVLEAEENESNNGGAGESSAADDALSSDSGNSGPLSITENTIVLGESRKSQNSSNNSTSSQNKVKKGIIYKSAGEYIKEYAPYAFSALCILLMFLLLMDRKKLEATGEAEEAEGRKAEE